MASKTLTPEIVVKYHRYLAKIFDFNIIDKSDAIEMQIISKALPSFVPIDSNQFMQRFSTTLYDHVYIPYKIGSGNRYELYRQMRVITHEAQHVIDFRKKPYEMALYLLLDSTRTTLEARALSTSLYLQWWYNQTLPNLKRLTDVLYYYGLGENDRHVARKHLLVHTPIAKKGQVPRELVASKAIAWLRRNCK